VIWLEQPGNGVPFLTLIPPISQILVLDPACHTLPRGSFPTCCSWLGPVSHFLSAISPLSAILPPWDQITFGIL
jgi:hypothetical protein